MATKCRKAAWLNRFIYSNYVHLLFQPGAKAVGKSQLRHNWTAEPLQLKKGWDLVGLASTFPWLWARCRALKVLKASAPAVAQDSKLRVTRATKKHGQRCATRLATKLCRTQMMSASILGKPTFLHVNVRRQPTWPWWQPSSSPLQPRGWALSPDLGCNLLGYLPTKSQD